MKKIKNFTLGGIQHKIFTLVLIMIVLVIVVYTVVIFYQINSMTGLVKETNEKQKEAITEVSGNTMNAVVSKSLGSDTQLQARIADDMFTNTSNLVKTIGGYAETLFSSPDRYPVREVKGPDASLDGKVSAQLLTDENVDLNDPGLSKKLGLMGNLADMMLINYFNANVDSCYVAIPEGVMILVDDHPSSKFDSEGNVIPILISERVWYKGAIETGGVYFSDVSTDVFTGQPCVMCSVPVYVDGKVAAVVGADLFLDNMAANVNSSDEDGGQVCIVNELGHVVFSPESAEGIFRVNESGESEDLRKAGNKELAEFIDKSLNEATDVSLINVDGTSWYMTGAPIDTVGWAVINMVDKAVIDRPAVMMSEQYDTILSEAVNAFDREISNGRTTIIVLLIIVVVIAILGARKLSKRIVNPLETMTKRAASLGGDDIQFRMEDTYRTGDEIEVLAESFATLSKRTLQYVDKVRSVTAEKERISAELNTATAIQASQLPQIFPAFPNRNDFDIYASMTPAKEVGGDFYDFFLIDEEHLGIVVADVSGKGVPAALFMMISKILIKNCAMTGQSPKEVLESVNDQICKNNQEEMFVTVWFGKLDLKNGTLIAANAGHEYPVVKHPSGSFELLRDKHGFVIGGMEGLKYPEYEMVLEPGSKLFLYTDGVAEAENAEKEQFGAGRMVEALRTMDNGTPFEVVNAVHDAVNEFVKDAPQFDDLTMLCIKYDGPDV